MSDEAPAPIESPAPAEGGADGPRRRRRRRGGGAGAAGSGSAGGSRSKSGRSVQYWLVVSTPDNFRRTREHGFTVQGFKTRYRKPVETFSSGDRIVYYVSGRMAFTASATVTSPMFEDASPIWRSERREETYPYRVKIRPDNVVEEADWVVAKHLAFRLELIKRWPPEHWNLAFQAQLHQLPKVDFQLIDDELKRILRANRRATGVGSTPESAAAPAPAGG